MRSRISRAALLPALVIGVLVTSGLAQRECARDDRDCNIGRYTDLIKADPNNAEAYYNRAIYYRDAEKWALAKSDLDRYVSFKIDDKTSLADGYRVRAWVQHKSGDDKAAFADIDKAFSVNPNESEGYYMRGMIYNEQKSYSNAVAQLTKYIEVNAAKPEFLADGLYQRGFSYDADGKYDLAVKDLTDAIKLNPENAGFYKERAYAYRKLGKVALAVADEAKAHDLQ